MDGLQRPGAIRTGGTAAGLNSFKAEGVPPYAVIIRTLGTAGSKYQRTLAAIARLTPPPEEVIVAIPRGYDLPPERLGSERFVPCDRGMVRQRTAGAAAATVDLLLFLDDDLEFPPHLAERLYAPLAAGLAPISFPVLLDMLPRPGLRTLVPALLAAAVPMVRGRDRYFIRILAGGGWSYRRLNGGEPGPYLAEAAPGACFLVRRTAFQAIAFDDEVWVERPGYALLDDQVMFYKFHCLGMTAAAVAGCGLVHLDAGTAEVGRRAKARYAKATNQVVFWHRFLYRTAASPAQRLLRAMAFLYVLAAGLLLEVLLACRRRSFDELRLNLRGLRDGGLFLSSPEYRRLPAVLGSGRSKPGGVPTPPR